MDLLKGLSTKEANERRLIYDRNELVQKRRWVGIKILLEQFKSPLVYVLLLAAAVTFWMDELVDMGVILIAVVVNTILGFVQEFRAERSLEALREVLAPKCLVFRDGERMELRASELVPGDIVYLSDEHKVPADGILIEEDGMFTEEAILTGESVAVEKFDVGKKVLMKLEEGEKPGEMFEELDRKYKAFMGTEVKVGVAKMLVVKTGMNTEVGKVARSLALTDNEKTPLQARLERLSQLLAVFVGVVSVIVLIVGLWVGDSFAEIFPTAVALAVAAIPEGLVVSLTVILAIGMQRILKRKAVVRKLTAAETLGSVDVIASDKTGTLTEGVMRVTKAITSLGDGGKGDEDDLVRAAILCNDLKDPLEVGMSEWARGKLKNLGERVRSGDELKEKYGRLDILPFDADERFLATLNKWKVGERIMVAGAPEIVLGKVTKMGKTIKDEWEKKFKEMAGRGYRLVGFGYRDVKNREKINSRDVKDLRWLGFLVYEDPVRKGVKQVLARVKAAGVSVKVITGDYRETAVAILRELGLLGEDIHGLVMDGDELRQMKPEQLEKQIDEIVLFARTNPEEKLKIVEALKARGHVVAMTGDGVNDAPALKRADIGIVVNEASEVSKETADMVLLDSNFGTIVKAIEEGRGIYDNLRKVIVYLLSDAFAEIIVVLISMILRWPLPLLAVQILWVNLVSDGFPDLALTVEPREGDVLKDPPRKRSDELIDLEVGLMIVLISLVAGLTTLAAFGWFWLDPHYGLEHARTVAFAMLGLNSLFYVFSSRSLSKPIWKVNIFQNMWLIVAVVGGALLQIMAIYLPVLQGIFRTVPLGGFEWLVVIGGSMVLIVVIEVIKYIFIHRHLKQRTGIESKKA